MTVLSFKRSNRVTRLEDDVADLQDDLDRCERRIEQLESIRDTLTTEKEELEDDLRNERCRAEEMEIARDEVSEKRDELVESLKELESNYEYLESRCVPLLNLFEIVQRNEACRSAFDKLLITVRLVAKKDEWDEISRL